MHNHSPRNTATGLNRFRNTLRWSINGLSVAFRHEKSFRQALCLVVILAPIGIWLGETGACKALLVSSLLLILVAELINSSIEMVVDRISREDHLLSGYAKDISSAAVFLTLINAALVWLLILVF